MQQSATSDFNHIYETYHDRVLAYATRLVGRDDAEDIAQEVFFRVSRSLDSLADASRLPSWIFAITLNTVRDLLRTRQSRATVFDAGPSVEGRDDAADFLACVPDTKAPGPDERASQNEMVACFLDYVKELPHDYLQVYVLSEFGDLTNPQIAERLSVPLSTVKARLHRARTRLYGQLRRDCECSHDDRGRLVGEPRRHGSPVEP